jgi:hypothetical protein
MVEPVHGLLHGAGGQLAGDRAARLPAGYQTGVRQHVEMLHDGGERHGERPGKLTHRNVLARFELRHEGAPRGVGQSGEGVIECVVEILNHRVKYYSRDIILSIDWSMPNLPIEA